MTSSDLEQKEHERALAELRRRAIEAERLASITLLTAGITHDIGTPLTAILGYAELIAKSVGDDKNRKRAATIVTQVHRVGDLIETLVNLSRTERGDLMPLELAATIDKALDFYREKFKHRGIEIERIYPVVPQILGAPSRLHHVFLSLFLIRLESMTGGGKLCLSVAATEAGDVEVRISDDGAPIDSELEAQIFGPNSKAPRVHGAAALGLRVAKGIVEEHKGQLTIEHGCEFCLRFPPYSIKAP